MVSEEMRGKEEEIKEKEEESLHHGGSFRKYMDGKIQKLQQQFKEQAADRRDQDRNSQKLFSGISIYVNGYTQPSHAELKVIMAKYGGMFHNYYSRRAVTHIVCSNLPDAKIKQFEQERDPTPVVRPEWIVNSIQAGKVLPIDGYILWRLRRGGPGQQMLPWVRPLQHGAENQYTMTETTVHDGRDTNKDGTNGDYSRTYSSEKLQKARQIAEKMRLECEMLKGPPKSSKEDPNFVQSFYRASRLHFIGTWKSRLENLISSEEFGIQNAPKPKSGGERCIVHIDMDCFFASVAEATRPEFKGLPLAVCHSDNPGSGEISSANYEARKYGIHASMFMAKAKSLCPDLIVVPYEFDKYEVASEQMYKILFKYSSHVQPVSCDEAYLDITGLGEPESLIENLRQEIEKETGCCASAGIGSNMLLARLATARAKPNGQRRLDLNSSLEELRQLDIEELPGVGWRTGEKLREAGIHNVHDIQQMSKEMLQQLLGNKVGSLLYDYAFGKDARRVSIPSARKSIGAEVNWGVRFESNEDAQKFLKSIASQISERLNASNLCGKTLTLKLKKKRKGWTEPVKYLGMGICDSLSKSMTVNNYMKSTEEIYGYAEQLFRMMKVHFSEIRGMGLAVTKLDGACPSPGAINGQQKQIIQFTSKYKLNQMSNDSTWKEDIVGGEDGLGINQEDQTQDIKILQTRSQADPNLLKLPQKRAATERMKADPIRIDASSIDPQVLEELPKDIREEVELAYGLKCGSASNCLSERVETKKLKTIPKKKSIPALQRPTLFKKDAISFTETIRMSQVDQTVLQELPESIKRDVMKHIDVSRMKTTMSSHWKTGQLQGKGRSPFSGQSRLQMSENLYNKEVFCRLQQMPAPWKTIGLHIQGSNASMAIVGIQQFIQELRGEHPHKVWPPQQDITCIRGFEDFLNYICKEIELRPALQYECFWTFARGLQRLAKENPSFTTALQLIIQEIQTYFRNRTGNSLYLP